MSLPSLALQAAIVQALKNTSGVAALVGERVYDRVPEGARYPYISLGPEQALQDDAECVEGYEIFQQIDVWSAEPGFPETKRICAAVHAALHEADLAVAGFTCHEITHETTNTLRDADGLTSHGAMTFRALIDVP